jgi:DNA-directed RNA polymerase specialized sigma subunit
MKELKERNQQIVREVKALEDSDIKYAKRKVGERYGISERRVSAIIKNEKYKELLKNAKNQ